jgi:hypothetical protein
MPLIFSITPGGLFFVSDQTEQIDTYESASIVRECNDGAIFKKGNFLQNSAFLFLSNREMQAEERTKSP